MRFATVDEAVALAADTGYGLSLGILTGDVMRGLALAERIPTGIVHINDQTVNDEAVAPFGGVARLRHRRPLRRRRQPRRVHRTALDHRARRHPGLPVLKGPPHDRRATPRRSGPTTSAACCARPRCSRRGPDRAAGKITAEELRAIEDDAIRDVVRMQRDVGLRSATDGEFRRTSWHMDFIYRLGGIAQHRREDPGAFPQRGRATLDFTVGGAARSTAPIRLQETIFGDDFAFLRVHSRTPA